MGRAIDMQKDIEMLKTKIERLDNIVRGMASELSEVTNAVFEEEEIIEETEDVKEEADNQGDGEGDESDDSTDTGDDSKDK
tara:strand:+ start:942 stop:1184 length:243 start_codon:yes stop_codon:yes gene_type:complete